MTADARQLIHDYAAGRLGRSSLMMALDLDSFADVLALLAEHGLKLPRAPREGRERELAMLRRAMHNLYDE